ncbi:hypothetical protein [Ruminiclostridium josui]|jgi:hypothetical protein|uniref:hypothetical protein n=1 Tax=Ruminiclostridium josui TaxID=1499 RepID=UPI000464099B|nr:hypothetical protein [Ruminiclostridium josui]
MKKICITIITIALVLSLCIGVSASSSDDSIENQQANPIGPQIVTPQAVNPVYYYEASINSSKITGSTKRLVKYLTYWAKSNNYTYGETETTTLGWSGSLSYTAKSKVTTELG